jgi:hypothetical protein
MTQRLGNDSLGISDERSSVSRGAGIATSMDVIHSSVSRRLGSTNSDTPHRIFGNLETSRTQGHTPIAYLVDVESDSDEDIVVM